MKEETKVLETATPIAKLGNETGDSVKRIGSKRSFNDFLIMPVGNKVMISKNIDKIEDPGSHKKIQVEIEGK